MREWGSVWSKLTSEWEGRKVANVEKGAASPEIRPSLSWRSYSGISELSSHGGAWVASVVILPGATA